MSTMWWGVGEGLTVRGKIANGRVFLLGVLQGPTFPCLLSSAKRGEGFEFLCLTLGWSEGIWALLLFEGGGNFLQFPKS